MSGLLLGVVLSVRTCWFHNMVAVLLVIIICCLLPQAFSPRYFFCKNGDPHRSGFKFQTAVLSVLCVMFQVHLSFVLNLLNVFPVRLPNVSVNILLLFRWLQSLLVWSYICCISVHEMLHCSLFSAAFCVTFLSAGIATSVIIHDFPFFFLIIIYGLLLLS
jgi:hypothetical protein